METEMETIKQKKKAALEKRKIDLQERTLAFLKKHKEHLQEIEHLHFLQAKLEEDAGSGAETDEFWSIDNEKHNPEKNPELQEMEMELENNQVFQNEDILITEEDVERYLKMSIFHFPKAPMLYSNGVAISDKPLESINETDYSVKFKFTLTPSVPTIRRRSLVFGKNPKTKKRLSMPGAYILLDEKKNIVGYEFDRNFRGEPTGSIMGKREWDFRGFDFENAFLEKPVEYMSAQLVHHQLKQGYVFFPSKPHFKNMKVSNLKQFQSKIREDGLIKVEDLIPENGSNQTYLFTQPGLTYDLPCLSSWEDQMLLGTSEPFFKIIVGIQDTREYEVIGYRIEQPQYGSDKDYEDYFASDFDEDVEDVEDDDEDEDEDDEN
jgi:hypothetical protein